MSEQSRSGGRKTNKRKKNTRMPFILAAGAGALTVLVAINILLYLKPFNRKETADAASSTSSAYIAAVSDSASSQTWQEEVQNALPEDLNTGEKAVGDVTNIVIPMEGTLPDYKPDWTALATQNPDIYAWITIPGTSVASPVLQKSTEANYYDVHDANGQNSIYGCVHSDIGNELDFTDPNTVIYGSSSRKNEQFAGLSAYADQKFFRENPYIYIYTKNKTYEYRVFAAYESTDENILKTYNCYDINEFTDYIDRIYQSRDMRAVFDAGIKEKVIATWNMITLSTPVPEQNGKVFLVQATLSGETENHQ